MRKAALITMFVVLAGVFCGGKTGSQPPTVTAKFAAEAMGTLTEDDVVLLVKVLPTFNAALKAGNWIPQQPKEDEGPVAALTGFVEGMNVTGVDDSLKKVGSNWGELRPIIYKAFAAFGALNIDQHGTEMIARMKQDTSAGAKKALKDYTSFQAACTQIPPENKQILANHQQELHLLQTLGR
jgi:hypothetical protein